MATSREEALKWLNEEREYSREEALKWLNEGREYSSIDVKDSVVDQFAFGMARTNSDIENLGLISRAISGFFPPEGISEEEFDSLSFDERRKLLLIEREADLKKNFPDLYERAQQGNVSLATNFGDFAGALFTPTTLVPIGQSVKAATLISGGLAAQYSVFEDIAQKGEVDLSKAGLYAGGGAALGGVVFKGVSKLQQVRQAKQKYIMESIGSDLDDSVAKVVAEEVPVENVPIAVSNYTGVPIRSVSKHINSGGTAPSLPTNKDASVIINESNKALKKTGGNTEMARGLFQGLDYFLGVTFTRIKKLSEPTAFGVRKFEAGVMQANQKKLSAIKDFNNMFKKLPKNLKSQVSTHLLNHNASAAVKILQNVGFKNAGSIIGQTQKVLKETGRELQQQGYKLTDEQIESFYFPRKVNDLAGLQEALNQTQKGVYDKALKIKAKEMGINDANALPQEIKEQIINKVTAGFDLNPKSKQTLQFLKQRTLPVLTEKTAQFYDEANASLTDYILRSNAQIHKGKFFGKGNTVIDEAGIGLNIDESIGSYISKSLPNLSASQQDELRSLLYSRFVLGEKNAGGASRAIRNTGYAFTLANPISAVAQIADIGVSGYANGMKNSIMAMIGATPKGFNRRLTWKELGGDSVVAQELTSVGDTSRLLFDLFTFSGFRAIDNLGKNTAINASLSKGARLAKTAKGQVKLRAKYQKGLGKADTDLLINDLASGTMSERVKMYALNELADIQPIFASGTPQAYLNSPNGRILYMLKTWSIKQLDILRNDILIQAKTDPKAALRNAIAFSLIVPTMGATVEEVRDFMLGRGFNTEDILTKNAPEMIMKTFGVSEYIRDKYLSRGDLSGAVINTIAPPLNVIDAVGKGIQNIAEGDPPVDLVKELPLFGRIWYNFFGGGLEKWQERQD
jgi:hypothetical protein